MDNNDRARSTGARIPDARKGKRLQFGIRLLVIWAIEVVGLLSMARLLPGVQVDGLPAAVLAVAAIGILNGRLWPLLSYLILPFAVLTLGLLSPAHGPVVIGAGGRSYPANGWVEGEDPLAALGPNAAMHLRRTDRFADAPDILISSFYDPETGEVAAFEELIGSHGGLGGWQALPFLMVPSALPAPEGPIVGAASLHAVLKGWAGGQA